MREGATTVLDPWGIVQQEAWGYTCTCTALRRYSSGGLSITEGDKTQTSYVSPYGGGTVVHGYYSTFSVKALMPGTWSVQIYVNCTKSVANGHVLGDYFVNYTINVEKIPEVVSITIPNSLSLEAEKTYSFSPTIVESGASTSLTWYSSETSIVSVSNNGTIKAEEVGMASVWCTASNGVSSNRCTVTVTPILVENIELERKQMELDVGEKKQIRATVYPWNASVQTLEWKSSDEAVAKVSSNGMVTGVVSGKCTITATAMDSSKVSESCEVTVRGTPEPSEYSLGDINGDGKVDVSDYIGVANHIMGNTPEGFILEAADVDENGKIDVSDYIGIANLILMDNIYGK